MADSGDRAGAVALLRHAVSLGRVNLGEDHPDVLAAAHQLARVHQSADDPSAARRVLEEAYAAGQWRLGDVDPLMLEISYDLGVVAEELGNRHEARKAFGRVAEHGPAVLGEFHWAVTRAQQYLGGQTSAVRPPPAPTQAVTAPPHYPTPGQPPRPVDQTPPIQPAPTASQSRPAPPAQPAPPVQPTEPVQSAQRIQPAWQTQPAQPTQTPQQTQPARPMETARPAEPTPPPPSPPSTELWPVQPLDVEPPPLVRRVPGRQLPPDTRDPQARVGNEPTVLHPIVQPRTGLPAHQPSPPPGPPPSPVTAPPDAPAYPRPEAAYPGTGGPAYPRRGPVLFAAIAAVLAAVIAVVALVFVLADRGDGPDRTDVPTLGGGPPPVDVRVRDFGSRIQVTWGDPGEGKTSFIVTGGHPGEVLKPMGEVGPGVTQYDLQGLNDQLDYCFAVVAVYGTDQFASSPQACTSRVPGRPEADQTD